MATWVAGRVALKQVGASKMPFKIYKPFFNSQIAYTMDLWYESWPCSKGWNTADIVMHDILANDFTLLPD